MRLILSAICAALVFLPGLFAASQAVAAEKISYESAYLSDGIDFAIFGEPNRRVRRLRIEGTLDGKGELALDANLCELDRFGETTSCTQVFYPKIDVQFSKLSENDSWTLYAVRPKVRIANFTLRLAISKKDQSSANFLLNSHIAPEVILRVLLLRESLSPLPAGTKPPSPTTHTVTMRDFKFVDQVLSIKAGDFVVWTNEDDVKHNAQRGQPSEFKTKLLAEGEKSEPIQFREKGRFDYFCRPHQSFMKGVIIVE